METAQETYTRTLPLELKTIGVDLAVFIESEVNKTDVNINPYNLQVNFTEESFEICPYKIILKKLNHFSKPDSIISEITCVKDWNTPNGFQIEKYDEKYEKSIRSAIELHAKKYNFEYQYSLNGEIIKPEKNKKIKN